MNKMLIIAAVAFVSLFAGRASSADSVVAVVPGGTVTVPGPGGTTTTYAVPVAGPGQQVVWVEEKYEDIAPRVEVVHEVRTRNVTKRHDVLKQKTVSRGVIAVVEPRSGRQPRLARGKVHEVKKYTVKESFVEPEEYLHPVNQTVYVQVEKSRNVPALISAGAPAVCK